MNSSGNRISHRGPALIGVVLFLIAGAIARTVDVPRTTYGIKSDEATYVAMALSAAFDFNLSYERRDLERFEGLYHQGPEGIFLKRGKSLRFDVRPPFPFLHVATRSDPDDSRLYFGKALIYPLMAAPFARVFGMNGFLIFHVLLLAMAVACAYLFVAAQSSPSTAALFTTAFFGAAAVPVYSVFLMPEIFNFTLVLLAYFLWLYKEVKPDAPAFLTRPSTDIAAAILLGAATYSKPIPNAFLVVPLVLNCWWYGRWAAGLRAGASAVATAAAFFALTAAISGEFNYQGGDRKAFYSTPAPERPDFPFDAPGSTWDRFPASTSTDGTAALEVLTNPRAAHWFRHNVVYFLAGRHFGLIPYYFPGVVAIILWLLSSARRDTWRVLIFAMFSVASLGLLLVLPFTWSGGGGPPGNRYLISAYPVLLFLVPPLRFAWIGLLPWIGGAIFTAKILVTPFESAKFTWLITERGPLRRLPVELTMANDLPTRLAQPLRARVQYGRDPFMLLYFLDQNAWPPEPPGMWVSGGGRAEIIVRTVDPIDHLAIEAESPISTVLTVSIGADQLEVPLGRGRVVAFDLPAGAGVHGRDGYAYVLKAQSSEGFVPATQDPRSTDYRNLGALMRYRPVPRQ